MNHYIVHWRSELPGPERDISTLRALFGLVLDDEGVAQALGAGLIKELREPIRGATERYVNRKLDRETGPTAAALKAAAVAIARYARKLAPLVGADADAAAADARQKALARGKPEAEQERIARAAAKKVAAAEEAMKSAMSLGWPSGTCLIDKDALALWLPHLADAAARVPAEYQGRRQRPRHRELDAFAEDVAAIWTRAGHELPTTAKDTEAPLRFGLELIAQVNVTGDVMKVVGDTLRPKLQAKFLAAEK